MRCANDIRKRILIVEDEPAISQVCMRTLNAEGFEVDAVSNGKIAQDALGRKKYDLCLIDIRTPVMNGKELYQYMKEKHAELTNKVIFTTGDLLSGDIEAFLRETNRSYLSKPFTPDELKAAVREALSRNG